MSETEYEQQWQRQLARADIPDKHLPIYRWYLRHDDPASVQSAIHPRGDLIIMRAVNPTVSFYRYLYETAGEEYLWGDRRRMNDDGLNALITPEHIHIMVLYRDGVPAGFYDLNTENKTYSDLKHFALLPGFSGGGLGAFMLNAAIVQAGKRGLPLLVDTCTLDHPAALENYKARGFNVTRGEDEIYLDPRLDGTVPPESGKHVPIPV